MSYKGILSEALPSTGEFPITPFVVGPSGQAGYQTIQAALDAANAAGGGTVYIQGGSYTENLTLYNDVDMKGVPPTPLDDSVFINGTHALPSTGEINISYVSFRTSGDIFTGGTNIDVSIEHCKLSPFSAGGHTFNSPNYAGTLFLRDCTTEATNDGLFNFTSASPDITIIDSQLGGSGTTQQLILNSGALQILSSEIFCVMNIGTVDCFFDMGSSFQNTINFTGSTTGAIYNSSFLPSTGPAINFNSAANMKWGELLIDTANDPAIAGSGSGTIKLSSVSYLNNDNISGSLTISEDAFLQTPEIIANNIERQFFSGFFSWDGGSPFYTTSGTNFTVAQSGFGYLRSRRITWSAPQTVSSLSAGATHYIYMDNTGTIGSTTTRSNALFFNNIVLFEVLVDSAGTPNLIVVRENHPYVFSTAVSNWSHDAIFTKISNLDKGANITLNGTKAIEIVGNDKLLDHGIETTIPDSGGSPVIFSFMYTNASNRWVRHTTAIDFPSEWNNAGTVTALGTNKFGIFTLYVSKDDLNLTTPKYFAVYDDAEYNSSALALAAIAAETVAEATDELKELEMARLGYVIKQESTDTISSVIINKQTLNATKYDAWQIINDTSSFSGMLSSADPTVQMALETIDNFYETGAFVPVLEFGGGSTGITYNTQAGRYTKIGDTVFICIELDLSNKGSSTGTAKITGLPFTIGTKTAHTFGRWENIDLSLGSGYTTLIGTFGNGDTDINVQEVGDNVSKQAITDAGFQNNSELTLVANYHV